MFSHYLKNIKPRLIPNVFLLLGKYLLPIDTFGHNEVEYCEEAPAKFLGRRRVWQLPFRSPSHFSLTMCDYKQRLLELFKVGKISTRKMKKTYSTSSGVHIAIPYILNTFPQLHSQVSSTNNVHAQQRVSHNLYMQFYMDVQCNCYFVYSLLTMNDRWKHRQVIETIKVLLSAMLYDKMKLEGCFCWVILGTTKINALLSFFVKILRIKFVLKKLLQYSQKYFLAF